MYINSYCKYVFILCIYIIIYIIIYLYILLYNYIYIHISTTRLAERRAVQKQMERHQEKGEGNMEFGRIANRFCHMDIALLFGPCASHNVLGQCASLKPLASLPFSSASGYGPAGRHLRRLLAAAAAAAGGCCCCCWRLLLLIIIPPRLCSDVAVVELTLLHGTRSSGSRDQHESLG